jgi:hypothetical protein
MDEIQKEMNERIHVLKDDEKENMAEVMLTLARCYGPNPDSAVLIHICNGRMDVSALNIGEMEAAEACAKSAVMLVKVLEAPSNPKDIH